MFRRLPVAGKLAFALLPLIVAVLGLGGIFAYQTYESVEGERISARAASAMLEADQSLSVIDAEIVNSLEASTGETVDLDQLRLDSDAAVDRLEESMAGIPIMQRGIFDRVRQNLTEVRGQVDAGEVDVRSVAERYLGIQNAVLGMAGGLPHQASNQELFLQLEGLRSIIAGRHQMAVQQMLIMDVVSGRNQITGNVGVSLVRINELSGLIRQSNEAFLAATPGRWDERFAEMAGTARLTETSDLVDELAIGGPDSNAAVSVGIIEWISRLDTRQTRVGELAGEVANAAIGAARANAAEAQQRVIVIAGITAVVVLLAILLTSLVARSVARRIREVADRARQVSEVQIPTLMEALENPREEVELPEPNPIRDSSKDELGELSRSFNTMQVTIDDVARRQIVTLRKGVAEIFVSLARRNRGLIDRQLAVIDELERDESDPEKLSDLYRLDHLATRMRRNAENLLVLAGTETPRRWRQAVGLDDCVRAAIGEVEDYRRVDVLNLEPIAIKGGSVTDVSHLLAELIDNATTFSPPQTRVRIAGYFDANGYLITVADSGVGLGPVKLEELNELLTTPPVIGLALEPTLGLYVVARLARRHGIDVRLVKGAPGVTAQVRVPASLYEAVTQNPPRLDKSDDVSIDPQTIDAQPVAPDAVPSSFGLNRQMDGGRRKKRRTAPVETRSVFGAAHDDADPRPIPRMGAIAARLREVREPSQGSETGVGEATDDVALPSKVSEPPDDVRRSLDPRVADQPPPAPEPALTPDGLPIRTRGQSSDTTQDEDGVRRSDRSATGIRTAFSQYQQGGRIARRGTEDDA